MEIETSVSYTGFRLPAEVISQVGGRGRVDWLGNLTQGVFSSPNTSSIMGSMPARYRGVASGMRSTFQNSSTALSNGVFFSLMVSALASALRGGHERADDDTSEPAPGRLTQVGDAR